MSFIGTLGCLFEDSKRIDDYSIFTFPRVVDGLWYYIKKKYNFNDVKNFSKLLFSVLMGFIFIFKKYYNKQVPKHYLKQFEFFFGS